jgi:hypothetical protein
LREQGSRRHGEVLEWIGEYISCYFWNHTYLQLPVIVLIAAEIVVAAINIVVDLWAGVE